MPKGNVRGPRVLVKEIEEEKTTKGGIIIPDTHKDLPMRGVIVGVGAGGNVEGAFEDTSDLSVGDHVMFGMFAGNKIKVDGDEYRVIKVTDLLYVIKQGEVNSD